MNTICLLILIAGAGEPDPRPLIQKPVMLTRTLSTLQKVQKVRTNINRIQNAKKWYDRYQTYKKVKKLIPGLEVNMDGADKKLKNQPWFTVDVWDHTFGRKQAKKRKEKKRIAEKELRFGKSSNGTSGYTSTYSKTGRRLVLK